jgi:Cu-Zn family superoxide dismutase
VGDYGNVMVDPNGVISATFIDSLSLLYGPRGIIGRTIALHEGLDDLGLGNNTASLANGNSGKRIACGIIGIVSG